jgi:gliding motility-associated-like protein
MKYFIIPLFFCFIYPLALSAQFGLGGNSQVFPFERVYPAADEDHFTLDLDTLPGGSFLTLAVERNAEDQLRRMNVTSFDEKGDINWTMAYEYKRDLNLLAVGDIEVVGDDSIVFTAVLDTVAFQRIITKIGPDGGHGWSKLVSFEESTDQNYQGRSEVIGLKSESFLDVSEYSNDGNRDFLVRYSGVDGSILTNYSLSLSAEDELVDVLFTQDSTIAILSNTNSNIVLTTLDTVGNVLSSRSFESPLDNVVNVRATNFTQLANSNYAISGQIVLTNGTTENLILRTSKDGNVETAHILSALDGNMNITDIDGRSDSTMVYMGFTTIGGEDLPYMAQMNLDSTLGWNSYSFNSLPKNLNGFAGTADGGAIMYLSGGTRQIEDRETPYLIRYNNNGDRNGLCLMQSLTISLSFTDIISSAVVADISGVTGSMDTITVIAEEYNGFTPPILTLPDTSYCPQDPINFPLDATVEGGLGYFWMGEFDRTPDPRIVIATQAGEYSVTVSGRNSENVTCWTLCDTSNVSQRELPMVQIEPNFIEYCETGEALLGISANNPIVEIDWSTGASQQTRIGVTQPGNYSVTIVDDCGNPGQASINISQSDFDIELPLDAQVEDTYCTLGAVKISLLAFNANPAGLTWSTGETGVTSILVSEPGTYSVMFEGFCSGIADINVSSSFFIEEGSIDINRECGNNMVILLASINNATITEWSTGNTGASAMVNEVGIYTVTGRDNCGDPITAEVEVTQEDLESCNVEPPITGERCLEYPNAFVPNSRDEINRTFAPKSDCNDLDIYNLKIYNRWGNKVFESDQVELGWDGRKGGKDAPADVYFFYSTYSTTGGAEFEEKGDLLLIR